MAQRQPLAARELDDEEAANPSSGGRSYRRGHWAWSEARRLQTWDPITTPASWLTKELQDALNAIEDPHSRKKRCTVLRLAEAAALGLGVRSVFEMEDTCNTVTWYGRSEQEPGWKDMPAIKAALELATRLAQQWQDREEAQRISLRQRQLASTQDELVDLSKLATETLADLMMNAGSEKVRLEAAETVLDRADEATAKKLVATTDVTVSDHKGPSMSEIRRRQRQRGERAHMDEIGVLPAELVPVVSVTAPAMEFAGDSLSSGDGDAVEWVGSGEEPDAD